MTALTNKQKQEALRKRRAELGLIRREYWATEANHKKIDAMLSKSNDKSQCKNYLYDGKKLSISQLVETTGLSRSTIYYRLRNDRDKKLDIKSILDDKPLYTKYKYKGDHLLVTDIAKNAGVSVGLIYKRIKEHALKPDQDITDLINKNKPGRPKGN